jgi:hypothetical protein
MRLVRYSVAASLDGYIAGPKGEFDCIPQDPTVDFESIFARVDTVLVGRRSYELVAHIGAAPWKRDTTHTYPSGMVTLTYGTETSSEDAEDPEDT